MEKKAAVVPAAFPGVFYGHGLFETILVQDGRPRFLKEHFDRLYISLPTVGLFLKKDRGSLEKDLHNTIVANGVNNGSAKITVCKMENNLDCHTIITVKDSIPYSKIDYEKGFKLITVEYKNNPYSKVTYVKSCNYLDNILARQEAKQKGGDEGLILNVHGQVAEGTVSNIFMVKEKKLYTPPINTGLLPGIVRQILLRESKNMRYPLSEKVLSYNELINADEVFITNSLLGIMPVIEIDGSPISSGMPGNITKELILYYKDI